MWHAAAQPHSHDPSGYFISLISPVPSSSNSTSGVVLFPSVYDICMGKLSVFSQSLLQLHHNVWCSSYQEPPYGHTSHITRCHPACTLSFGSNKHSLGFIHGHIASETLSLLLECVLFTKWVVGGWETRQNDGSRIVFMNKAEWKAEWHCSEETNVKLVSIKRITNRSQES